MNPTYSIRSRDTVWTIALWLSFFVISGFFAFGAAVQVDWGETHITLTRAIDSLDWSGVKSNFPPGDYEIIVITALAALVVHTFSRSWKVRLGAMTAGLLIPVYSLGPVILWVAVVSPFMLFGLLSGQVDGEFYEERMPMIAAIGLWMLLCLVYAIRELLILRKNGNREKGHPAEPMETPLS